MNHNQAKAIERIKAQNGGALPSDLYLQTNADLSKLIFDLTGSQPSRTASKKSLVARIEKHNAKAAAAAAKASSLKRQADDKDVAPPANKKPKKAKPLLSAGATAEARRVMAKPADEWALSTTHTDLRKVWARIGMKAQYPFRTSKAKVIGRLRKFAEKCLV